MGEFKYLRTILSNYGGKEEDEKERAVKVTVSTENCEASVSMKVQRIKGLYSSAKLDLSP